MQDERLASRLLPRCAIKFPVCVVGNFLSEGDTTRRVISGLLAVATHNDICIEFDVCLGRYFYLYLQ